VSGIPSDAPRISVGIPVYNGEPFLAEALACLSRQDVSDAEFIICDNASTDRTAEIAAEFVANDRRFRIIRQSATKPADENFADVLHMARGEFFCWRAADDLSSDNFLSELAGLLISDPDCMLATCLVRNIRGTDMSVVRTREVQAGPAQPGGLWRAIVMMQTIRAAAFYGLWRRDEIMRLHADARARFPWLVAQDMLILLSPILQGRIATTNKAIFVQRLKRKSLGPTPVPFYAIRDPAEQARARSAFLALAREQLHACGMPPLKRLVLRAAISVYVERRVFRLWHVWLGKLTARRAQKLSS
jgi:glycosyltransferase involved in cell wall biosynthesis